MPPPSVSSKQQQQPIVTVDESTGPGVPPVANDEGKLSVFINFGTTFSGVVYGSSRIAAGKVQQVLNWSGYMETFRKIPHAFSMTRREQSKNIGPVPSTIKCEWFKLFLEPCALREQRTLYPRCPSIPTAIDPIIDYLFCLWDCAEPRSLSISAPYRGRGLTVPAAWDAMGFQMMRDAAIGQAWCAHHGSRAWICAELKPEPTQVAGRCFLISVAAIELMRTLLADHPAHLDAAGLTKFMEKSCETDILTYMGEQDNGRLIQYKMLYFTCFNVEDPDDPLVGLGLELIEGQTRKIDQGLDALLLVGGFSGSNYLFRKVEERFSSRIGAITRPSDCDTASAWRSATPLSVKFPAELEDWLKRPAYIRTNNNGAYVCENRQEFLRYLVAKGAILRKGQRLRTKSCKYSQTAEDRMFVATLHILGTDRIMRYMDEGETTQLCQWTVDLGVLLSFQHNASMPHASGFYADFEFGLDLDSSEIRGALIYKEEDWSHVVLE
ncbi:actin-like ATPase domain-containing protein [Amylocystis lapponica]|nr:actin-like ATPase domain-containing protein [Amylocystis lapponica]